MPFLTRFFASLPTIILGLPVILLSLSFHEMSHAFVSYKLGDPTARNLGRLTLNPVKHIDPIGFICMVLFHFGWAKPVPINTRYFKNPRRDMALSAGAGPLSNLILALIFAIVLRLSLAVALPQFAEEILSVYSGMQYGTEIQVGASFNIAAILITMLYLGVSINFSLALFNLIPLPPMDGSRLFYVFLPTKLYFKVMKYERFIQIAMLLALWTGLLTLPLGAAASFLSDGVFTLLGMSSGTKEYFTLATFVNYVSSFLS